MTFSPSQPSPAPPLSRASLVIGLYGAMALVGLLIAAGRGNPDLYRLGSPEAWQLLMGPILGAVPLFLLFEWLSANFPNHYSIILGLVFIAIVFVLPRGVLAFAEENWKRWRHTEAKNLPAVAE